MNRSSISAIQEVAYPENCLEVERVAATELGTILNVPARSAPSPIKDGLNVCVYGSWKLGPSKPPASERPWLWAKLNAEGTGEVVASTPAQLVGLVNLIPSGLTTEQQQKLGEGLLIESAFNMHRPLFDTTLTQVGRSARDFDAEQHIAAMARMGFTHVEVNALQSHVPLEPGVPHEYYAQFYSYCAGLNHFVDSDISRGFYPLEYLTANLNKLKKLAALARKYGMRPGILCFEPRSMPEAFFKRYPTLRGGRIDHPFRSHLPRYTLAQDHPVAQEHYRQMITNLVAQVPDLAYMSVWTNDSGAGFEHTASLYVGRNGGPYLIREWRSHEQIAASAATSALGWMKVIRDAAAKISPDFEVALRLEPFKEEHDLLIEGMGNGLTVEVPSLLVRGYELPYTHPRYPEQSSVAGTIFHDEMDDEEGEILKSYRKRRFEPKFTYSCGAGFNTEPLLGIPFPRMLGRKLDSIRKIGGLQVNAFGGLFNTAKTPYWPNAEIIRLTQLNPELSTDRKLELAARQWVSEERVSDLIDLWDDVEECVSYLPSIPLYSAFGFVWLRTWVRPLTPNLEAVPRDERAYFERFMVTTPNNPSINDLGQDVLFQLITEESGRKMTEQFDSNVLPRLDSVLAKLDKTICSVSDGDKHVFEDLRDRAQALKCWATTQRNTVAWVAGVYAYMDATGDKEKKRHETFIQEMIDLDLENTHDLLDLLQNKPTEVILLSDVGETSFVYGDNICELLRKKIELTNKYRNARPHIDREIMWRVDFL